jgi:hypothetical protein
MDPRARHPFLTRATRLLGIVLSLGCVAVLAPATLFAWRLPATDATDGPNYFALFVTGLLTVCTALLLRGLFAPPPQAHGARFTRRVATALIGLGVAGCLALLASLIYGFGSAGNRALMLSGIAGCIYQGLAMRRRGLSRP